MTMSSAEVSQTAKLQRACRIWKALAIGALAALALVVVLMTTLVLSLYNSAEVAERRAEEEAKKAQMNLEQAKTEVRALEAKIEIARLAEEAKGKREQPDAKRILAELQEEVDRLQAMRKHMDPPPPGAKRP
jgi:hypothetical protein